MKKKIFLLVLVILLAVPVFAGCVATEGPVTVRGGGWIPAAMMQKMPANKVQKATFGFTVKSYNIIEEDETTSWDVKGNFLYNDHFNKVRIKGTITDTFYSDEIVGFNGEYEIDGVTGQFTVYLKDDSESGGEDMLTIYVETGEFSGYYNSGPLNGGNLKVF